MKNKIILAMMMCFCFAAVAMELEPYPKKAQNTVSDSDTGSDSNTGSDSDTVIEFEQRKVSPNSPDLVGLRLKDGVDFLCRRIEQTPLGEWEICKWAAFATGFSLFVPGYMPGGALSSSFCSAELHSVGCYVCLAITATPALVALIGFPANAIWYWRKKSNIQRINNNLREKLIPELCGKRDLQELL